MSRIISIDATRPNILAECAAHNIAVSMIETLESGGSRVVLFNSLDAASLGALYGERVMTGPVTRTNVRFRHPERDARR